MTDTTTIRSAEAEALRGAAMFLRSAADRAATGQRLDPAIFRFAAGALDDIATCATDDPADAMRFAAMLMRSAAGRTATGRRIDTSIFHFAAQALDDIATRA